MLILTRRVGETILINQGEIIVKVLGEKMARLPSVFKLLPILMLIEVKSFYKSA